MKNRILLTALAFVAAPAAAQDELADFLEKTEAETVQAKPASTMAEKSQDKEVSDEQSPKPEKDAAKKDEAEKREVTKEKKRAKDREDDRRRTDRRNRRQDSDAGMSANTKRLCPSC
uniref:hypothetical protein n=1 Tax=uncultured Erythrobacter sp. TaxID=263913 RepID=UPI002619E647|nr:hypothetical protein [uncultured Erythrobacter sp.]